MPIPLLNLDDRKFADLFEEMRTLIPRYAPEWTNHNTADPGIMLLELFAWLTEATIYRVNRVPEASKLRFLRLLGAALQPAQPASLKLTVTAVGVRELWTLPRGTVLIPNRQSGLPPLPFEILHDIIFTPRLDDAGDKQSAIVTARQMARVERENIGVGNGRPFQLFAVTKPALLLPPDPFPVRPKVYVDNIPWEFVANFQNSSADAKHFTIKLWLNKVIFGNGKQGQIPPPGASIAIDYRYAPSGQTISESELLGESKGQPDQAYRLQKPFFPVDLQATSELEPRVFVNGELWRYRPTWLEMDEGKPEFTVEPWRNAIRFGDGVHGKIPPDQAKIEISYVYTSRPALEIPTNTPFSLVKPLPTTKDMPTSLTFKAQTMIDFGSDATGIEAAKFAALDMIKPRWRTVTADDFEAIVVGREFNIARVHCLPSRNLDAADQTANQLGHVSVSVAPQARSRLQTSPEALAELLCFSPDGGRLVARTKQATTRLWDLESGRALVNHLGDIQKSTDLAFNATSQRLFTISYDEISDNVFQRVFHLWDANNGEELAASEKGSEIISAQFSPDGNHFVTISTKATHLHEARYGAHTALLSKDMPIDQVVFSTTGRLLAAAGTSKTTQIWDVLSGAKTVDLSEAGRIALMCFSQDEHQLASTDQADEHGVVRLWRTESGVQTAKFEHGASVIDLCFNRGGERLVTRDAKGAQLWNTRRKSKVANLLPSELANETVKDLAFSPDGRWLAVAYSDNFVRLWDVQRGEPFDQLKHTASVLGLAFSPSGQELAILANQQSATPNRQYLVCLWTLRTPWQEPTLLHTWSTSAAVLSQSGNWLTFVDGHLLPIWSIEGKASLSMLYLDDKDGLLSRLEAIPNSPYLFTVNEGVDAQNKSLRTVQVWHAEHVYAVKQLLNERRLVTCQHHVAGPMYTNIYIKATVVRGLPLKDATSLQREIASNALSEFFHPLRGGPERTGWPWGRNVYVSEVYQVLESVGGVDHVEALQIDTNANFSDPAGSNGRNYIKIPDDHLVNYIVCPEAITIADAGQTQMQITRQTVGASPAIEALPKG